MSGPLDAVTAIHNAFRRDMAAIDAAGLAWARSTQTDSAAAPYTLDVPRREEGATDIERFRFFNEVLVWHAHGEELAVFPALEVIAPSVAEAYVKDHRGLDAAFDTLDGVLAAGDSLETARATAAFKFHLDIHLAKEDSHLYRLIKERISVPDQGKLVGVMSSTVPPERFPEVVAWMFPLLGDDDRENMTRVWQMLMPPEVFTGVERLIERSVGDGWPELTRRVPELSH